MQENLALFKINNIHKFIFIFIFIYEYEYKYKL